MTSSSAADLHVETVDPGSWVHPDDLQMWQFRVYQRRFNANLASYEAHYKAAVRKKPSRISEARMEITAHLIALERLKSAGTELDRRSAQDYGYRGYVERT